MPVIGGVTKPTTTTTSSASTAATTSTSTTGVIGGKPKPVKFNKPLANITLPPNLGRPPRASDLIITKGFDGKTPQQAVDAILSSLQTPLAAQNKAMVTQTANDRFRDFNTAMNNCFTPNSPNNTFLKSLGDKQISLVGTMSMSQPTAYKAVDPKTGDTKYYARDWSGNFAELSKPPQNVVMEARLRLDPPGLAMTYPKWSSPSLSGPLSTITEM